MDRSLARGSYTEQRRVNMNLLRKVLGRLRAVTIFREGSIQASVNTYSQSAKRTRLFASLVLDVKAQEIR